MVERMGAIICRLENRNAKNGIWAIIRKKEEKKMPLQAPFRERENA